MSVLEFLRDIVPVKIVEDIENPEHRDKCKVQLPSKTFFGG